MMRQRHAHAAAEEDDPETQVVVETIEQTDHDWNSSSRDAGTWSSNSGTVPEPAHTYDYSREFANSSAIRSAFSLDNKRTKFRFRVVGMFLVGFVVLFALKKSSGYLFDWWAQEPKLPYRACEPLAKPPSGLIEELLAARKTTSYICSTQDQRYPQPCACCVLGSCWRDVHFIQNTTVEPEEIVDRVDGQRYIRHIPKSSQICYKPVDSDEFDRCERLSGKHLNAVLRAIEKLRGWAPAGELKP
jgi:hypothetical protein